MTQPSPGAWAAADRWLADTLLPPDPAVADAIAAQQAAGMPDIEVSPLAAKEAVWNGQITDAKTATALFWLDRP